MDEPELWVWIFKFSCSSINATKDGPGSRPRDSEREESPAWPWCAIPFRYRMSGFRPGETKAGLAGDSRTAFDALVCPGPRIAAVELGGSLF